LSWRESKGTVSRSARFSNKLDKREEPTSPLKTPMLDDRSRSPKEVISGLSAEVKFGEKSGQVAILEIVEVQKSGLMVASIVLTIEKNVIRRK
jgi:hypothetical protein